MKSTPTGNAEGASEHGPHLGEVLEFMRLLWALHHGMQSTSKRMEATLGLTGPQRLVLRLVGRFPGIAAGVVLIVGIALMLAWWYRTGDRKAQEEITAVRSQNPFGNGTI